MKQFTVEEIEKLINDRLASYGFTRADVSSDILEAAASLMLTQRLLVSTEDYCESVLNMLINVAGAE